MAKRLVAEHFLFNGKPKRSFPTKSAAKAFLTRTGQQRHVYCCGFCGKWHLSSH